jgi:hypothetical protein
MSRRHHVPSPQYTSDEEAEEVEAQEEDEEKQQEVLMIRPPAHYYDVNNQPAPSSLVPLPCPNAVFNNMTPVLEQLRKEKLLVQQLRKRISERDAINARLRLSKRELVEGKRKENVKLKQTLKDTLDRFKEKEESKKKIYSDEMKAKQERLDDVKSDLSASRLLSIEKGRELKALNRNLLKMEKEKTASATKAKEIEEELKSLKEKANEQKKLLTKANNRANSAETRLSKNEDKKAKANVECARLKLQERQVAVKGKAQETIQKKKILTIETERKVIVETHKARIKRKLQGSAISKKKKQQREKKKSCRVVCLMPLVCTQGQTMAKMGHHNKET